MRPLILFLFFFFTLVTAWAQTPKFSDDPAKFITEVQPMMEATRNVTAMNVGTMLEMAWNSGKISQNQKERIVKFSQKLQKRRVKTRPHFENYFGAVGSAVNVFELSGPSLTSLLDVIEKSYEKEDPKAYEQFMASTYRFLDSKAIYQTTTNSLKMIGGTFSFEYRYGNEVDEEPVVPKPAPKPQPKPEPKKAPAKKETKKKKQSDGWDDWGGWDDKPAEEKKDGDAWGDEPIAEPEPAPQPVGNQYLEIPVVKGPAIIFKNADLEMTTQFDVTMIKNTSGVISLAQNLLVGRGGTFAWNTDGNDASVELKKYSFDTRFAEFKAEGAVLTYPALLEEPIEGVFEHRNKKRQVVSDSYPRFASFTNNAKLKNLGEDIKYRGGFTMAGSKIMSAALDNSLSYITVSKDKQKKFRSFSRSYRLADTVITADLAAISIYQDKDSITHPGSRFKYSKDRSVLTLNNDKGKFKYSPFRDSYHRMDILTDLVIWNLGVQEINFSILTAKNMVPARVESQEYFSNSRYQQLKGIGSFHPLQMIVYYATKHNKNSFYVADVARETKIKEAAIKTAMSDMDRLGYLEYNPNNGQIILQEKAKHYVAAARNQKDYDHISIRSTSAAGKNAVLNLDNKILLLRGVKEFSFSSDSGAIVVKPDSGLVCVKKNRDMDFNGRVVTPNFIFKGSEFKFSYNDFWIDMAKIDSLIFRTRKKKPKDLEKVEIQGQKLDAEGKPVVAEADKAKEEEPIIEEPEYPEDDSVRIAKIKALKLAKKQEKEKKKKEKALARQKAREAKKPKLDEFGDPIIEEEGEEALADAGAVAPAKKPKPKINAEKALTGLNGKLYLNKPNNKSGRRHMPGYPMFDASTGATVYFNQDNVLDGAYDSTVYFTIPPFKLDSVGSSSQSAVNFKGTFHSGNMFPPIETRLTIMPDQSMGFEYQMPEGGLDVYGKGKATGTLTLNANGLQTKGSIQYLTSVMKSDSFTFFLDSVTTKRGLSGKIAASSAGNMFPEANIGKYTMKWLVNADSMMLNKPDSLFNKETMDPIALYNGKFTYTGQTIITPQGLKGSGVAESDEAKVQSPYFVFNQSSFKGNNANLDIKSENPDKPGLTSKDIQLSYDLQKGHADFAPEKAGVASTTFPGAQFSTSLSGGHWDFAKKTITMKQPETTEENAEATQAFFVSTNPELDSLKFTATSGFYDLSTFTLKAGGVPKIAVNDTYVIPGDGNVEVADGSDIKVLSNASLVMDTLNQYHKLTKGEIDIINKKEFTGTAVYEYQNSVGKNFQITFNTFTRDSAIVEKGEPMVYITKATGTVTDEQQLELLPKIMYRGDVNVTSNKALMDFNGEMKLAFGDDASASEWFPYKNTVSPDSIRIQIENMKNADGEPLITGLHFSNAYSKIYNTFVSKKTDEADLDMFLVSGMLSYDKNTGEYKLGTPGKAYGESYEGNVMNLNIQTSEAKYDGKFKLIKPINGFNLLSSGTMLARLDSGRVNFDSFLTFDINLPSSAWAQMGAFVGENAEGLPEAIDNSTALFYKMGEFVGNKGVQDYANRTSTGSVPFTKFSSKLVHSLTFADVDLRWSAKNNAWYSVGKLSLASIDKKDINAQVNGHIEIKKVGEADVVTVYLEASPTAWYYLSYTENALTVTSSDDKFNTMMASKLKPAGTVATAFTPIAGEAADRSNFVTTFRNTYLGGHGEPLVEYKPAPTEDAATEAPTEPGQEELNEDGTVKKAKKKKKKPTEEGEEGQDAVVAEEGATETPAEGDVASEEAPVKKKKKSKAKTEDEDGGYGDVPADDASAEAPAEEVGKKKKKSKEKTEDVPADAPVETPAEQPAVEAPAEPPVEKKKKTKEKVEETPAEAPVEAPAEPPVEKKKKTKEKVEEAPAEEPAEAPAEEPVKKKKEKKEKVEEEPVDAATEAPAEEEPVKKKKEKKSKNTEEDAAAEEEAP